MGLSLTKCYGVVRYNDTNLVGRPIGKVVFHSSDVVWFYYEPEGSLRHLWDISTKYNSRKVFTFMMKDGQKEPQENYFLIEVEGNTARLIREERWNILEYGIVSIQPKEKVLKKGDNFSFRHDEVVWFKNYPNGKLSIEKVNGMEDSTRQLYINKIASGVYYPSSKLILIRLGPNGVHILKSE